MWIARDEDDCLWVYKNKPVKKEHNWDSDDVQEKSPLSCYMKEFKYVKWTDKEPKRLILNRQMNIQNLHGSGLQKDYQKMTLIVL